MYYRVGTVTGAAERILWLMKKQNMQGKHLLYNKTVNAYYSRALFCKTVNKEFEIMWEQAVAANLKHSHSLSWRD